MWQVDVPADSVETARQTNGLKEFGEIPFRKTDIRAHKKNRNYLKEVGISFYSFYCQQTNASSYFLQAIRIYDLIFAE